MSAARAWLLAVALVLEIGAASAAHVGDLGRPLSDSERAEVARLGSANGKEPWLFVFQRGHFGPAEELAYVYSVPAVETAEIRRGTWVLLSRRFPSAGGTWEGWTVKGRGWYAQVTVPGRDPIRVEGERDTQLPFDVGAKISGQDIVSLATLIRSGPSWTDRSGNAQRVEGSWPIQSIHRKADGTVEIRSRKDIHSGQWVKLKREQDGWHITGIGSWIA